MEGWPSAAAAEPLPGAVERLLGGQPAAGGQRCAEHVHRHRPTRRHQQPAQHGAFLRTGYRYPHRRVPDIPALSDVERDDFARLYLDVLHRLDGLYDERLPYISAWHQAVVGEGRDLGYLHLQLFSIRRAADKLKYLAGSESAMGAFVSDVVPEKAAQLLRDAA